MAHPPKHGRSIAGSAPLQSYAFLYGLGCGLLRRRMNFGGLWHLLVLLIITYSPCHIISSRRDFIPCSAFELSPGFLPVWTTPLLKKEWHLHPLALVTDIYSPTVKGLEDVDGWPLFCLDYSNLQ